MQLPCTSRHWNDATSGLAPTREPFSIRLHQCLCKAAPAASLLVNSCDARSWETRISAMRAARRAYARALHLAPGQGSLWGDVSATFYHEAQLRRAHPKLNPNQAHSLRKSAETLMRGLCSPVQCTTCILFSSLCSNSPPLICTLCLLPLPVVPSTPASMSAVSLASSPISLAFHAGHTVASAFALGFACCCA